MKVFKLEEIIKKADTKAEVTVIGAVVFIVCILFSAWYEKQLLTPAPNTCVYVIGAVFDKITTAIYTGYAFYFFTDILPNWVEKRRMSSVTNNLKKQFESEKEKRPCGGENTHGKKVKVFTKKRKDAYAHIANRKAYRENELYVWKRNMDDLIDKVINHAKYLDRKFLKNVLSIAKELKMESEFVSNDEKANTQNTASERRKGRNVVYHISKNLQYTIIEDNHTKTKKTHI